LNRCTFIGNVGGDPELRYTTAGMAVATFSIAINESWKDADGAKKEHTEWVRIVVWRKLAEIVGEHVKKGQQVYVEGKMSTRKWEKDNITHYVTEVIADSVLFLGTRTGSAPQSEPPPSSKNDDLPF
jgi:single-strand DNA-binding protein